MATEVIKKDGKVNWTHEEGDKYLICGTDITGKKFRLTYSTWLVASYINVYRGRKYLVRGGKRHLLVTIYN